MNKRNLKCKYCKTINPVMHLCSIKSITITDKDCNTCTEYDDDENNEKEVIL